MTAKPRKHRKARKGEPPPPRLDLGPFVRRALLIAPLAALVWFLVTPAYNRLLIGTAGTLVRLGEGNPVTRLQPYQTHYVLLHRADLKGPGSQGHVGSVRVSDIHFPVILTAALFLATATASPKRRFGNFGWALLVSVPFHVVSLVFWVQFILATQLGSWSMEHYSALARNFWGLGKHLLDLPFKFALPLLLWCAFYFPLLDAGAAVDVSEPADTDASAPRPTTM